jgi:hypothetical protein
MVRKIESVERGHSLHVHLDAGAGYALCGWNYLAEGEVDGHPIFRGRTTDKPFTCTKCRWRLLALTGRWLRDGAPTGVLEDLAARVPLTPGMYESPVTARRRAEAEARRQP